MINDVVLRALIGALGIALVAGPLGCFLVWRKMAYFGDTLAHSALLGVALGMGLGMNLTSAILLVCLAIAFILVALQQQRQLANDTLLCIMAHSTLACGMLVVALTGNAQEDLVGFLFGDILQLSWQDCLTIYLGSGVVLVVLGVSWRWLMAMIIDADLARVEGTPIVLTRMILNGLLALVIALAMKMVGVLLVTSLLIIPAASARRFARSPECMAVIASLIGMVAVGGGLTVSVHWKVPAGPCVVMMAAGLFLVSRFTYK